MSSTRVSVLLPAGSDARRSADVREELARYLHSTGFGYEIVELGGDRASRSSWGESIRRGISEAHGDVVVIVDEDLPYGPAPVGDAVAMIEAGSSDVVVGTSDPGTRPGGAILRWLLVDMLPDPAVRFMACAASAAGLVIGESSLAGAECVLEMAFLANKYGFRVEPLHVVLPEPAAFRSYSGWSFRAAAAIRMRARRMGYRAWRRCPVCFSSDVSTAAQLSDNLVRACSRCKCRYLNEPGDDEDGRIARRVIRGQPPPVDPQFEAHSIPAREKDGQRRLALLRRQLPPRARVLEIGVRDGSFGLAASRDYEYVGIDRSNAVARAARARGLEVYCGTASSFVNTGPAFDAIALFHVLENMADPHDALGRIKDLLKPGGVLVLTTFDTEGLLYLLTERRRLAQMFRTHRILYSRSALIELLEHSGFEIEVIGPDFAYRDHRFLRHLVASRWPWAATLANAALSIAPDPMLVGTGSVRIVARRRAGSPFEGPTIRSAEATHAR